MEPFPYEAAFDEPFLKAVGARQYALDDRLSVDLYFQLRIVELEKCLAYRRPPKRMLPTQHRSKTVGPRREVSLRTHPNASNNPVPSSRSKCIAFLRFNNHQDRPTSIGHDCRRCQEHCARQYEYARPYAPLRSWAWS